jgi:hypothetical protein
VTAQTTVADLNAKIQANEAASDDFVRRVPLPQTQTDQAARGAVTNFIPIPPLFCPECVW